MQKDSEVKTQVEFYLSDNNLSKDAFFYTKILEDKDGYIDLDLIMNCNKIKTQGITKDNIKQAVKDSTLVELNSTGDKIRRKDNKALPEPKFKQKKLKTQENPSGSNLLITSFCGRFTPQRTNPPW